MPLIPTQNVQLPLEDQPAISQPAGIVQGRTALPANQQLTRNPVLPPHPLGAYTDAQYEAAIASLRAQTQRAYADILKRLGFLDPDTGQFVPGQVEVEAWKRKGELDRELGLAAEAVTQRAQQEGTLFSGLRGVKTARAQYPFVSALADLDVQVPLTLGELYENAAGLVEDYALQQNGLLAQAAARRAAMPGVTMPTAAAAPPELVIEPAPDLSPPPYTPNLQPAAPPQLPAGNTGTDERGFPVVGRGSGMVSPDQRSLQSAATRRLTTGSGGRNIQVM